MDFEPPSFSLGFDGLDDFSLISPSPAPAATHVEPDPTFCAHGVPERRFKRLRRLAEAAGDGCSVPNVVSEQEVANSETERCGGEVATESTRGGLDEDDDDIEDFSDQEVRPGGSLETAGREKHWEKSPLTCLRNQVTPAGYKGTPATSTSSRASECLNKQMAMTQGKRRGIEHFRTATGYSRPSYVRKPPGVATSPVHCRSECNSGKMSSQQVAGSSWEGESLGSKQTRPVMEQRGASWIMRQPNFDDADAASRGVNAIGRTGTDNAGCRTDFPSDCHHGFESSFPSFRATSSDIIDLEAEWDDEAREHPSDGENINPTGSGPSNSSTDFCHMFKGDRQIVELLRERLSHFIPVDALATRGGFEGEPVYIDYRNQFLDANSLNGPLQAARTRTKQSRSAGEDKQNYGKKRRGRGQSQSRIPPRSHPTPDGQTGAASGKGYWTTEKAGNRIYVTQDGRKLSGQIAYRQHLRENGKQGKKKPKASRASKK